MKNLGISLLWFSERLFIRCCGHTPCSDYTKWIHLSGFPFAVSLALLSCFDYAYLPVLRYWFFFFWLMNWHVDLQSHIRTLEGRIVETILSLRFFIFQYGVVYKLDVQGSDKSLTVAPLFMSINVSCFILASRLFLPDCQ